MEYYAARKRMESSHLTKHRSNHTVEWNNVNTKRLISGLLSPMTLEKRVVIFCSCLTEVKLWLPNLEREIGKEEWTMFDWWVLWVLDDRSKKSFGSGYSSDVFANAFYKPIDNDPSVWSPATHKEDLDGLVASVCCTSGGCRWRVSQKMEVLCVVQCFKYIKTNT